MTLLSALASLLVVSQMNFKALGTDETGINIVTVCQDSLGCLWFGGIDGITRYDGSRFTNPHPVKPGNTGIYDNHIKKIICDSDGKIWLAHISGLSCFLPQKNAYYEYPYYDGSISDIVELSKGRYLTISNDKLTLFDDSNGEYSRTRIPSSISDLKARSLYESGSYIYVGTIDGRIAVLSKDLEYVRILDGGTDGYGVNCMLEDSPGHIWIGTEGNGLWSLSIPQKGQAQYKKEPLDIMLEKANIRALSLDTDGALWAGTKNGLAVIREGHAKIFHHDALDSESLSHDSIHEIFRDKQGTMWVGTYYGGVCYHISHTSGFEEIYSKLGSNNLNGNIISDIAEDTDGSIWIGTNAGVLNHLKADGSMEYFHGTGRDPIDIKDIYISSYSGKIYIGADRSGLSVVNKGSRILEPVPGDIPLDIYSLEDNGNGKFFIGARTGLFEYDERAGICSRIMVTEDLTDIKALKTDSKGVLWIGKKLGVSALDLKAGKFIDLPESLRNIWYVEDFLESSGGVIWICSNNGLFCMDPKSWSVASYTEQDGLPSNVIHGVEEDSKGMLWISTNAGLCRMDPVSGEKMIFTSADGLPANRFCSYAHCKTKGNEMYFGGLQWVVHFRPEDIGQSHRSVSPIISTVLANGEAKTIENGTISLKPGERNLTISFSSPDYISGQSGHFLYKMDGVDNEWNESGTNRTAIYHKLKHGKYTFHLTYRNSSGIQSDEEYILKVKVAAYWYEALITKIIGILLLVLVILLYIRRQLNKNKSRYKSELEKVRNELLRDFTLEFATSGKQDKGAEKKKFGKNDEDFMRKAMQIVKDNISNADFSVDMLASEMNMSRSNLHLRTRALFGTSPLDFIKKMRFNQACHLLQEGQHSVSEISYMTGFSSPSYFVSAFHKFMGCTPKEYASRE